MSKKKGNALRVLSEAQLKAKYKDYEKASIITAKNSTVLRLPSRILSLNYQMNGGIPFGRILELFGEESTGKSALAIDFGAACQALGGEIIWADLENSYEKTWYEKNGVDLTRLHVLTEQPAMEVVSDWVQDTIVHVRSKLTNNEPILLVLDSLAAARCLAEIGEYELDASAKYGNRAKAISDFLGKRNTLFAKAGVPTILINQLRRKIGATKWEDPDKTVGGDSTKFYAHQRMGVIRGKQIKEKVKGIEFKTGHNAYIRTKKDKTGPPRETTSHIFYFRKTTSHGVGFERYTGLAELLVQLGGLERSKGSSRYYKDGKMLAHGEEAIQELLVNDPELRASLVRKVKINTISKTLKKIESLNQNLYGSW